MRIVRMLVLIHWCGTVVPADQTTHNQPWTWLYEKKFTVDEQHGNGKRQEIQFARFDVPSFTQLVFSWNGFRSCSGHFSFWAQVRDAQTHTWGSWHKMIEWGATIQRSYLSKKGDTSYHHVRLEMMPDHLADAFRVRIMAHEEADLSLLKALAVSLSDFSKFKQELLDEAINALPSVYVKNVPRQSQFMLEHEDNRKMCSPTSCSMLTGFLTDTLVDPLEFAAQAYDTGLQAYGSWPFNTAHAFERCNGRAWFTTARLASFCSLHKRLQAGIPVVVSVRGELEGAPKKYESGHLMVVVGWNARKKRVICHDPALDAHEKTLQQYPIDAFLRAWERSHRLAYLAEPAQAF